MFNVEFIDKVTDFVGLTNHERNKERYDSMDKHADDLYQIANSFLPKVESLAEMDQTYIDIRSSILNGEIKRVNPKNSNQFQLEDGKLVSVYPGDCYNFGDSWSGKETHTPVYFMRADGLLSTHRKQISVIGQDLEKMNNLRNLKQDSNIIFITKKDFVDIKRAIDSFLIEEDPFHERKY